MRIVSLIPSGTEIIAFLGAETMLVGRSLHCDYPSSVQKLPVVASPNAQQGSEHASLAGKCSQGVDIKAISDLEPDLILVSPESVDVSVLQSAIKSMPSSPELLVLDPSTVEDIIDDLYRVGQAIGCSDRAMHEAVKLRQRMDRAEEHINPYDDGPICGFMAWTDPIFIAGHWTVQIIGRAGARHPLNELVARPGSGAAVGPQQAERIAGRSIAVSPELFCATQPKHLVIAPCGLDLDESVIRTTTLFETSPWFRELPAVVQGRVAVVDGMQMFNRPGPRVVDALEFMVGWLNGCDHLIPDDFPWMSWSPPTG